MTGRAPGGEVRSSGFGIADEDSGRTHAPGIAAAQREVADVRGDLGGLLSGQIKFLRAFANAAVLSAGWIQQELAEQRAVRVFHGDVGAEEIGAALFAAAGI